MPAQLHTHLLRCGVQVTLAWWDVSCTRRNARGGKARVLQGVCGVAWPGQMMALLGPSGAGVTSHEVPDTGNRLSLAELGVSYYATSGASQPGL